MSDTVSDPTSQYSGLLAFLRMMSGSGAAPGQQNPWQTIAQAAQNYNAIPAYMHQGTGGGMQMHRPQQVAIQPPMQAASPGPFQIGAPQTSTIAAPMAATVAGPMQQTSPYAALVPYASSAATSTLNTPVNPLTAYLRRLTMPSFGTMKQPTLSSNTSGVEASDPFTTGAPNQFGAR